MIDTELHLYPFSCPLPQAVRAACIVHEEIECRDYALDLFHSSSYGILRRHVHDNGSYIDIRIRRPNNLGNGF